MTIKRRAFLMAGAAALGASHEIGAQVRSAPGVDPAQLPFDSDKLGQGLAPCGQSSGVLGAREVIVSGASGIRRYTLAETVDVRDELIEIFEEALSQLPAHIEFGPGDLNIRANGITVVLPKGGRGLSISGNGTRFRLSGPFQFEGFWHCLRFTTDTDGISPENGEVLPDADYFSDLTISDMVFYDDDPSVHSNAGVEETHGINLQWVRNARITHCTVDNVGDEGIELDYCQNAIIANNTLINTTQEEFGGGGAISIKQGCDNIAVIGNTIRDGGGLSTYGIALKMILPAPTRNVTIAGNTINNMVRYGINISIAGNGNNQGAELVSSISITGNTIRGGRFGIGFSGGLANGHTGQGIDISGNIFSNLLSTAIRMTDSGFSTVSVSDNTFENIANTAILATGDGLQFSNNNMVNVSGPCITLTSGLGATVNGGTYRGCGADADALFDETVGFSNATISNVSVIDCRTPVVIRNFRHISGCVLQADSAGVIASPKMIDIGLPEKGPASVSNNQLENGCIRVEAAGSLINGNQIIQTRDPGANAVRILATSSNCLVSGNHVTAFSTRFAIDVAGNNALVTGNHVAQSANAIRNVGSGNTLVSNKGNEAAETGSARMNPAG